MRRIPLAAVALLLPSVLWARGVRAEPPETVPEPVRKALREYLEAPAKKEKAALDRLLGLVKDDLALAVAAIRAREPLAKAKAGTLHGQTFESGGRTWEYSVRLPGGYDGKRRHPALVLPDHGSVDAEAGIAFWDDLEDVIVFRPVIAKYQEDEGRFPDQQFFRRDAAMAAVMNDALATMRLRYAVDPDRVVATGLSQAGYYTWYYAVSFPDQFAGIVPESAGGLAVRAAVRPLARNLAALSVRILHTRGDKVCPFADAEAMRDAIAEGKGKAELIAYSDADYGGSPFPNRHPGPHHLRKRHVASLFPEARRAVPTTFTRVLRYPTQGFEGRFRLEPPKDPTRPLTVSCFTGENGLVTSTHASAVYLADPADVLAKRTFQVGVREDGAKDAVVRNATPKADLRLLFATFKRTGDDGRLVAAEIPLGR